MLHARAVNHINCVCVYGGAKVLGEENYRKRRRLSIHEGGFPPAFPGAVRSSARTCPHSRVLPACFKIYVLKL